MSARSLRLAGVVVAAALASACNALTGAASLEIGDEGAGGDEVKSDAASSGQGTGGAQTSAVTATSGAGGSATTSGTGTGSSAATAGAGGASSSGSASTSASGAASSASGGMSMDATQLCVDTINAHRATLSLPPYARWNAQEACASDEAAKDAALNQPHSAFPQCGESAQNECPNWPGPPEAMIEGCMQMMWDEGPGADFQKHGHFLNMSSTQFTKVACGYHITGTGNVWAIQNFQ